MEFISIFRKKETLVNLYLTVRIYFKYSLFHYISLILANSFSCSYYLSVKICKTNLIIIYKVKSTNTTSYKTFTYIATYTTNTKNGYSGISKFVYCLFANQ